MQKNNKDYVKLNLKESQDATKDNFVENKFPQFLANFIIQLKPLTQHMKDVSAIKLTALFSV